MASQCYGQFRDCSTVCYRDVIQEVSADVRMGYRMHSPLGWIIIRSMPCAIPFVPSSFAPVYRRLFPLYISVKGVFKSPYLLYYLAIWSSEVMKGFKPS